MFSPNFTSDMSSWLPDPVQTILGDQNDHIVVPPTTKLSSPRRKLPKKSSSHRNLEKKPSHIKTKHRSLSPISSPKTLMMTQRSISEEDSPKIIIESTNNVRSPRINKKKPIRPIPGDQGIQRVDSSSPRQDIDKPSSRPSRSPRRSRVPSKASSPRGTRSPSPRAGPPPRAGRSSSPRARNRREGFEKSPTANKMRNRPTLNVTTKAQPPVYNITRPFHCSEDPQPSPKINGSLGVHLSEEAPMSPKVHPNVHRDASVLGQVVRARKQTMMNRGYNAIMKPISKKGHLPGVEQQSYHNKNILIRSEEDDKEEKEEENETSNQNIGEEITVKKRVQKMAQLRESEKCSEQELMKRWEFTTRHDIDHKKLKSGPILDKRHASRSVRCVIWKKKKKSIQEEEEGEEVDVQEEKFAMKMIMRTTNLKHVFNEKEIMLVLNDSPWHTKLIKTFKSDNNLYMLLEYAESGSLNQQIVWGRGLKHSTPELILFYATCIIKSIQHMHKHNIMHRDIKPDNLLIDSNGYLKLCDYGLSKFLPLGERTNTFLGTLAYMPPEQMDNSYYNHSVDYWGLGITIYEMIFGVTPFEPIHDLLSEKEWKLKLKNNIKSSILRFPNKNISFSLKLFIKSLLFPNIESRLGGDLDVKRIENHSCFSKFDWNALYHRTMEAPSSTPTYDKMGSVL